MPRFSFLLPRSGGCRRPLPLSKSQDAALKSQMTPLTITQTHVLPPSIPSITRGISVLPTTLNSSLHRRQPLRSLATRRQLTEAERSPATAGRRSVTAVATVAGVVACLSGSSAKASTSSEEFVKKTVSSGDIVVFSKSYCTIVNFDVATVHIDFSPFTTTIPQSSNMRDWYCATVKAIFKETNKDFSVVELDEREDGQDIQDALATLVGRRTVPQVFIKGEHIGGCDDTMEACESGRLAKLLAEIP